MATVRATVRAAVSVILVGTFIWPLLAAADPAARELLTLRFEQGGAAVPFTLGRGDIYRARAVSDEGDFDIRIQPLNAALNPVGEEFTVRTNRDDWTRLVAAKADASMLRLTLSNPGRSPTAVLVLEPWSAAKARGFERDPEPFGEWYSGHLIEGTSGYHPIDVRGIDDVVVLSFPPIETPFVADIVVFDDSMVKVIHRASGLDLRTGTQVGFRIPEGVETMTVQVKAAVDGGWYTFSASRRGPDTAAQMPLAVGEWFSWLGVAGTGPVGRPIQMDAGSFVGECDATDHRARFRLALWSGDGKTLVWHAPFAGDRTLRHLPFDVEADGDYELRVLTQMGVAPFRCRVRHADDEDRAWLERKKAEEALEKSSAPTDKAGHPPVVATRS